MRLLSALAHIAHHARRGEFCCGRGRIDSGRRLDAVDSEKSDQNQQRKCDWSGETVRAARFVGQMRISFAISASLIRGWRRREQFRTLFAPPVRVVIIVRWS